MIKICWDLYNNTTDERINYEEEFQNYLIDVGQVNIEKEVDNIELVSAFVVNDDYVIVF